MTINFWISTYTWQMNYIRVTGKGKVDRLTHERRSKTEAIATERQKKKFEDKTQQNRQSDLIEASPEETQRRIVLSTLLRKNYLLMYKVF